MSLRIYLLGQFRLQAHDRFFDLPSRPAQSLMAYLALNAGVTQRRERLAGLLWPDAMESNARSYLRQALWRIRKSFNTASLSWEAYLQISDISVTFDNQADYWLDTEVFLRPLEGRTVPEMIEMICLYREELLPGFYDEWVLAERDRLQAAYHQHMKVLIDRMVETGQFEEVLNWSEEWIRLGHSPEPAFRALMRAYASLGDQGMAGASYQRCVESMERELGLEPSLETRKLHEQIREGKGLNSKLPAPLRNFPAIHSPSFLSDGVSPPIEKTIFVARDRELGELEKYLELSLIGQGRVVFITGEAGGGKTGLIHEFTHRALEAHENLIVAGGNCNAHTGTGDPYLPFREILELLSGDVEARFSAGAITAKHARRLWRAFPYTAQALVESGPNLIGSFVPGSILLDRARTHAALGDDWLLRLDNQVARRTSGSIAPSQQQSDIFEQYTAVMSYLASKLPLILIIDDMQWADLGSINLLFHLGRQLKKFAILLLCAYRPEDVSLGRDGDRHPLEPVVNELQREYGESILNIDRAEKRLFVEAILDSKPNHLGSTFREKLYRQTGGQPLFTIELLRGMQERGDLLKDRDGNWIEGPSLDWDTLPARVEAVIAERVGRLEQHLRRGLRVASVEGDVFTAEVLAKVLGTDANDLLSRLGSDLDRKHRLIQAQSILRRDRKLLSRYQFRHTLFQKYLYSSLNDVERVHLHEQVGMALEELYAMPGEGRFDADIAPQLARHYREAQIPEKEVHYLQLAGERSLQLSAYEEAIAQLSRGLVALREIDESSEKDQLELKLQYTLGVTKMNTSPWEDVDKALTRARELCQKTGDKHQMCQITRELAVVEYVKAEYRKSLMLVEETLKLARDLDDPLLIAIGHCYLGFNLLCLGEFQRARIHLGKMIAFYKPELHHQTLLSLRGSDIGMVAIAYDACCLWCLGYPDSASVLSQQALDLARKFDHPFSLADVLNFTCLTYGMLRDAHQLEKLADEQIELTKKTGLSGWLSSGYLHKGVALVILGQTQKGTDYIHKGIAIRDVSLHMTNVLRYIAESQLKDGLESEAAATLAEASALIEETEERLWEAEIHRIRGEMLLAIGEDRQAEISLNQAIEVSRNQEAKSWELRASLSLARLMQQRSRLDEALDLLVPIYDWFEEGFDTTDVMEAGRLLEELNQGLN